MTEAAESQEASKLRIALAHEVSEALKSTPDKAQRFFAELAAEARKPHYGGQSREWMHALLVRAETAGIYTPETP